MPELHPYLSPKLADAGFRHGFFGRVGGHSTGAYSSLNCSYSVGDEAANVTANLASVAAHFGLMPNRLVTSSQVHGCCVLDADDAAELESLREREGDALVGASNAYALCIRTADCVPVLIGCRSTGMAAAVHAGWRGIVARVVPAAVEALINKGAVREAIVAAVGPHIGPVHFEVS
ncbi:MAG TPA: polyphenol oxidase family protein, partial [Polyangiaceae bacterium]